MMQKKRGSRGASGQKTRDRSLDESHSWQILANDAKGVVEPQGVLWGLSATESSFACERPLGFEERLFLEKDQSLPRSLVMYT